MQSTDVSGPLCILKTSNLVRTQLVALVYAQGRVAFLPFCIINLTAVKPKPYSSNPATIGDHLKKRRHELGLRQKDVARQLRVNEFTVCEWEIGKKSPSIR